MAWLRSRRAVRFALPGGVILAALLVMAMNRYSISGAGPGVVFRLDRVTGGVAICGPEDCRQLPSSHPTPVEPAPAAAARPAVDPDQAVSITPRAPGPDDAVSVAPMAGPDQRPSAAPRWRPPPQITAPPPDPDAEEWRRYDHDLLRKSEEMMGDFHMRDEESRRGEKLADASGAIAAADTAKPAEAPQTQLGTRKIPSRD